MHGYPRSGRPGDQFAIVGHHAGHGPAELRHAGSDLRHLVVAVHLGIAGIGAQPVDRPGLDLARREDEVHGVGLGMWRVRKKAPARGFLRALFFDGSLLRQGG